MWHMLFVIIIHYMNIKCIYDVYKNATIGFFHSHLRKFADLEVLLFITSIETEPCKTCLVVIMSRHKISELMQIICIHNIQLWLSMLIKYIFFCVDLLNFWYLFYLTREKKIWLKSCTSSFILCKLFIRISFTNSLEKKKKKIIFMFQFKQFFNWLMY